MTDDELIEKMTEAYNAGDDDVTMVDAMAAVLAVVREHDAPKLAAARAAGASNLADLIAPELQASDARWLEKVAAARVAGLREALAKTIYYAEICTGPRKVALDLVVAELTLLVETAAALAAGEVK